MIEAEEIVWVRDPRTGRICGLAYVHAPITLTDGAAGYVCEALTDIIHPRLRLDNGQPLAMYRDGDWMRLPADQLALIVIDPAQDTTVALSLAGAIGYGDMLASMDLPRAA